MAAAGEGPSSGYGGNGGVGGKFRKRPFRKAAHATPYDRPPTPLGNGNPSWLSKLVVEPASKLIASGAQRFFASVFRKRLPPPPPPPPPPPEVRQVSSNERSEAVEKSEAQEAAVGVGTNLHHNPVNGGISDLEGLLKKNTFTRSEVDHLTELLQSRTVEGSHKNDFRTESDNEKLVTNSESQQQYLSSPLVGKSMPYDVSHGLNSTPAISARVLEEDIASPAEIAKAYMGNQASRFSPSMLGLRTRAVREDATLLRNVPFTPKSSVTPMATKGAHVEGLGNGFVTPRSRGRSAIYSMARTPYSRVHPTASGKGSGSRLSGFGGPLPALSVNEQIGELGSNRTALKRRSSVLDDDLGSVGPMRKTRQKPSVLSHNTLLHQGIGSSSTVRQRSTADERAQRDSKVGGENDYLRTSRTSYGHVPPKSTETAEKIFDHLEKLTSNSKSPAKLTTDMLRGQALKSLEDADSSKLLYNNHVRNKLDGGSPSKQINSGNSSKSKDRTEIVFQKFDSQNNVSTPAENGDIKISEGTSKSVEVSYFVAKADAQHPPKKQGFTMSFHEDLDDDNSCDGPAVEISPKVNANQEKQNSASVEKSFPDKLQALPKDKTPSESVSGKSSDLEGVDTGKAGVPLFSGAFSAASPLFTTPASTLEFESTKQASNKVLGSDLVANPGGPEPWSYTLPNPDRILVGSEKGIDNSVAAAAKTNGKMDNSPSVPVSSMTSSGIFSSFPNANNGPPAASPSIFSPILSPASTGISNSFHSNGTSNIASSASTSSSGATILFSTASTSATISSTTEAAVAPKTTFNFLPAGNPSISASNAEVHAPNTGKESSAVNSSSLFSSTTSFTTAGNGSSYFGQSKPSTVASLGQDFPASSSGGSFLNAHTPLAGSGVASVSAMVPVQFASSTPLVFGSSPVVTSTSSGAPFSSTSVSEAKPFNPSSGIFGGFNPKAPSSATNVISSNTDNTSFSSGESSSATTVSVTNAIGSSTPASTFVFGVSSSATTAAVTNAIGSSTPGYNSFASNSSAGNVATSSSASVGGFGANPFSSTGFSYGSSSSFPSTSSAPVLSSSTGGSFGSSLSFTAASASASSFQSPFGAQPGFVASAPSFTMPAANNDQMQEETMADDPVNLSMPAAPVFAQQPGNMFQSSNPFTFTGQQSQAAPQNPFAFTGQQNQAAPQNPNPFQASGSQELSAGGSGSFSIGSGAMGGDKSGRKFVKPSRIRRKK